MKIRSIFTQALCVPFALFACAGTFAKDKPAPKKSGSQSSKAPKGNPQSRVTSSKPSARAPSRTSAGPSRSPTKSKPRSSGPSHIARSGPSNSKPHASPRHDSHRMTPHVTVPHRHHSPVVPYIRPHFGPSFYYSPWLIQPMYGVSAASVQRALAERGFYYGVIDGVIGPMTQRAIASFQSEAGLPVTGEIDGALLRALDL